jgi:hypothetical protein
MTHPRSICFLLVLAAAIAGLLAFPVEAHALDVEVGAHAGAGATPAIGTANPLGFGVGGRAGVDTGPLYAGVEFTYYLGGTKADNGVSLPPGAAVPQSTASGVLYGVEAGYNAKVSIGTVRPTLGLGAATLILSVVNPSVPTYIYLRPGVALLVTLGTFFVGGDVTALVMAGAGPSFDGALTADGEVGVKF